MILRDLDWIYNDDFGLLYNEFNIIARINKNNNGKFELIYASDSDPIDIDGDNIEEVMSAVENRIQEISNLPETFPVNNNYEFKGFDWIEIAEYLNLDTEKFNEVELMEMIKNYSYEFKNEIIPVLKNFLKVVIDASEQIDYFTSFWKGLLEIQDDDTFLACFNANLGGMWT